MKKTGWVLFALLVAVPISARAQTDDKRQAQAKQRIVLDIRMVEAGEGAGAELEKSARDKRQVESLIANGKARLIAEFELEAAENGAVATHIGQRVPIQTASVPSRLAPRLA